MTKRLKRPLSIQDMAVSALFAAVISVCSWIAIPTTVPFTMQTFAVFLAAGLLGARRSCAAIILYIFLAVVGMPVLSGFRGGVGALLGPTGGYVLGFLFIALIAGYASDRFGTGVLPLTVSMALGMLVCYAFGTAWFIRVYAQDSGAIGLSAALTMCVIPYIIPDAVKLTLAVIITRRLKRLRIGGEAHDSGGQGS